MIEFAREIQGKKCVVRTDKDEYNALVKMIWGDWIELDDNGKRIYLNLFHVHEIIPAEGMGSISPRRW